ncbi:hypothetical protein [Paenibacillus sp.]|uniref:hypothetical protein n=1 Tax=Paenibacillus sp. TaxID=58172 RepID=UPI002D57BB63|nr:hypothetical protein [Paenibacillus sp.]HZG55624.1 hypothetical protein [Paenibacillus sp.]
MVGTLALIAGVVCILVSLIIHARAVKKAGTTKEKLMEILGFIIDPFIGLTALFYLGALLVLYGACVMAGLL